MIRALERIWKVLISLKLAVIVIASLSITLMTATIIESKFDSKTAQFWVYRATWFYGLLALLGLNILAVAISRYPWKKKHTPFLMAHAGILMILTGSWLTYINGLDGSLRISEGEVSSAVELDSHVLVYSKKGEVKSIPFDWMPDSIAKNLKPYAIKDFGIQIEKFISDAEAKINFSPSLDQHPATSKLNAAILIRILGSPMGGAPEFWLWAGDVGWSTQKLGPARFLIRSENQKDLNLDSGGNENPLEARLDFVVNVKGELHYEATSIRGEKKKGPIPLTSDHPEPVLVNPEWKMPIKIEVKKFIFNAVNASEFESIKVKAAGMGTGMPNPAIQISLLSNPQSKLWLGLGDRAEFNDVDGTQVSIGYFPRRVVLPYALRLKKFEMLHNPGTQDPAAYSSDVQVVREMQKNETEMETLPVHHISMNEPLAEKGYTFYQASYIPDMPRPTTTILSVNYDPGRVLKYWGSILLVLGAILLYLFKAIQRKKPVEME